MAGSDGAIYTPEVPLESRTRPPTWQSLRWLAGGGACALLLLALSWLPGRMMQRQAAALEQQIIAEDITRLRGSIRGELLILEDFCRDWSDWDDVYRYVQDRNKAFEKANLGWDSLLGSTRIHLLVVRDSQDQIVWSGFRTRPDIAHPIPPFLASGKPLPRKKGFLLTPEGPLLLSVRPILQSNGLGPPRGTLVMGRLLDATTLARIRLRESLAFEVRDTLREPLSANALAVLPEIDRIGHAIDFGPERADVHTLISDLERRGGLWVTQRVPRTLYRQGVRSAWTVSFSAFGALLGAGSLLALGFLWYRRKVQHQEAHLQEAVEMRTKELQRVNHALEEASMVDPLTGLRNRRYAEICLREDVAHVLRKRHPSQGDGPQEDLVFFVLDLDHFKSVNDTHGHAAGDDVLRKVGDLLRRVGRASDLSVRWGGEEFLLVARHTLRAHAPSIAENLLQAFRDAPIPIAGGKSLRLTCSIGFCPFPVVADSPEGLTFEQAIILADHCMYAAKRSGRNGWVGILPPDTLEPRRLLETFPRGFIHFVKSGIVEVRCSFEHPDKLTWM